MKNTQIVAERIKTKSKQSGVTVKKLLEDCSLGVNTVTKMSAGNDILSQNLLKIADYLGCSVDYLLGRTDKPERIEPAPAPTGDALSDEMLTRFNSLDFADKAQVISLIAELSKKKT